MKPTKFNCFVAFAALVILPSSLFAADRVRNTTSTALINQEAWDGGISGTPGSGDRGLWNGTSVGGATTLGGDASWSGIFISGGTPSSGPLFTNAVNTSPFTLTLGADGVDLNAGSSTNRGISFESNTKLDLASNQTWQLGIGGTSANIVASSVITGVGSLEITRGIAGSNYAQLAGANTFSGGLTLAANSWVRVASSSVTSLTTVTSGPSGTGNLTLSDGSILTSASSTGYVVAVPQINLLGNVTLNQSTGGTGRLQIAGTWDLGGASRTLTIEKPAVSLSSGQEGLGFATPTSYSAPKIQNGSLTLSTVSGTAVNKAVVRFTTSTFDNNAGLTVDDGVAITSQNGSFFATGVNSPALTLNAAVTRGGGLLQMGDGINSGNATMRSAAVYSLAGGGEVSSSNTSGILTIGTLTIGNGNNANFSGVITEAGGTGRIAVTKSGAGTQTLSGTNTYTGKTTISTSGSILKFGKQVSLYNNTPASWTDTNIQVDSSTTLALHVGGVGEFTSSDIATLAALGTASGGFKSNSRIGFDTTNASGGTFTYSNVLGNPNAGANALGVRKLGAGTLTLDQANTFTGGSIIEAGTLRITQANSAGAAGSVVVNAGATFDVDFSGIVAPTSFSRAITGTGTINATPADGSANVFSFTSSVLPGFTGTINVKPSLASSSRVDFGGLIGSGATINIASGATARFALTGTYSGLTINVAGAGGSGPGALRLQDTILDASCAVNLTADAGIGSFAPVVATIDAVVADGGNGYGLTKSGSNTLTLSAANTYTGDTSVSGGTLRISKPYLANASDIVIGTTAILDLNFDESGGAVTDTVNTLTIGGVQQAAGVYGATGSGAPVPNDTNFAGIGTLTVLNGPAPSNTFATWIGGYSVGGLTGANDDFDSDGLDNAIENLLGSSPAASNTGLTQISTTAGSLKFRHSQSNTIASDVTKSYQWSTDLVEWKASGQTNAGGTSATIAEAAITENAAPLNDLIEVTVSVTGGAPTKVFGRLVATKTP